MIFETVSKPAPSPGEILESSRTGSRPWDGLGPRGVHCRNLLGSDLYGEVAAPGFGISNMAAGDEVFGVTNTQFLGAYAEYAVLSAACARRSQARLAMWKRLTAFARSPEGGQEARA